MTSAMFNRLSCFLRQLSKRQVIILQKLSKPWRNTYIYTNFFIIPSPFQTLFTCINNNTHQTSTIICSCNYFSFLFLLQIPRLLNYQKNPCLLSANPNFNTSTQLQNWVKWILFLGNSSYIYIYTTDLLLFLIITTDL